jgi:HD-GYP domain-containing protein (c-di-GMP phosphodiesterase class II)
MPDTFGHVDNFRELDDKVPLSDKLCLLHQALRQNHPFIDRVSIAIYDAKLDMLKTLAWSSDGPSPLTHYQYRLSEASSLMEILEKGRPRVVNDMDIFSSGSRTHTRALANSGFGASYTLPMYRDGNFMGFIFFNSFEKGVFSEAVLNELDMVGHMLSLMVSCEKQVLDTLQAAVRSAMSFTHHRDPETAEHIDRMSRYSRLIARELAPQYGFDDQFVEHVFLFSPLHDLGKIAIPDRILLKPGRLTDEEFELMKTHADKGRDMIDALLANFGLDAIGYVDMLRNIACHHHEAYNGSGYPQGLKAENIPIEARIVAVADVFDALTSERPYKKAWDNERAFRALRDMAGVTLDRRCVEVLIDRREEVEQIQQRFRENRFG